MPQSKFHLTVVKRVDGELECIQSFHDDEQTEAATRAETGDVGDTLAEFATVEAYSETVDTLNALLALSEATVSSENSSVHSALEALISTAFKLGQKYPATKVP